MGGFDDAGELAAAAGAALEAVEAQQTSEVLSESDADSTLVLAAASQRELNLVGAHQLAVAAHWADLHGVVEFPGVATQPAGRRRGREVLAHPGGDGTPEVAEFAPAELGAVLGISVMSAGTLIADALDLRHRLPQLWQQLQTGAVKVWVARRIAARTRRLSQTAAATVDAKVARLAVTVPFGRLEKVLDAAILAADHEQAAADTTAAGAERGVWVGRDTDHGVATVFAKAAAPDVAAFSRSLDTVARALKLLGDTDTSDTRRARALGVLADPQAALDLVGDAEQMRQAAAAAAAVAAAADSGSAPVCARQPLSLGPATLYLHIARETLSDGDGVARVEGIGPVLLDQLRDWLGDRTVTIRPVLDIAGLPAVDCYEIPERMADAVRLRTPADSFPYSANLSRRGDLDHTIPYVPIDDAGPPGQTAVGNLARMTRRSHRAKTHGKWTVTQPRSGVWLWRSPHGYYSLVDHAGTTGSADSAVRDAEPGGCG